MCVHSSVIMCMFVHGVMPTGAWCPNRVAITPPTDWPSSHAAVEAEAKRPKTCARSCGGGYLSGLGDNHLSDHSCLHIFHISVSSVANLDNLFGRHGGGNRAGSRHGLFGQTHDHPAQQHVTDDWRGGGEKV